ncbi:MAG: hypothetical protein IBX47_09215 [Desulfuromonadales bacterium]|nr:hypothetical protein [Desulfuromonadales bacterium]
MSRLHRLQPGKSSLAVAIALLSVVLFSGSSALAKQNLNAGTPPGNNNHPHNMSSIGSSSVKALVGETDQICIFCHTPHNASSRGPLWNRPDISSPLGGGSFPLYGRLNEIIIDDIAEAKYGGANEYPNGATRLCLSCHDGVTAVGAVISAWGGPIADIGPMKTMIIDLSTSHPVSFTYDSAVLLPALNAKTGVTANQYQLPAAGILDDLSRMQCTACHDPHTDTNDGTYTLPMWRHYTNSENADYEATCGECHIGGSTSGGLLPLRPAGGIHPLPTIP